MRLVRTLKGKTKRALVKVDKYKVTPRIKSESVKFEVSDEIFTRKNKNAYVPVEWFGEKNTEYFIRDRATAINKPGSIVL